MDVLAAMQVVRRRENEDAEVPALVEALRTLAPCQVVAQSYGAFLLMRGLQEVGNDVRRAVLIEPLPFDRQVPLQAQRQLPVRGDHFTEQELWASLPAGYRKASASLMPLARHGVPGASHMVMRDTPSDAVLDLVLDWLLS